MTSVLSQIHTDLLLFTPPSVFADHVKGISQEYSVLTDAVSLILNGRSSEVMEVPLFSGVIPQESSDLSEFLRNLKSNLDDAVSKAAPELASSLALVYAISLGQSFTQLNFTGPAISSFEPFETLFQENVGSVLSYLDIQGFSAYEHCTHPLLLVCALYLLEQLHGFTLMNIELESAEKITQLAETTVNSDLEASDIAMKVVPWWHSRYLQIQMSLFHASLDILLAVSLVFLSAKVLESLSQTPEIYAVFNLETARNAVHADLESMVGPALEKARKITGLDLVLTGAKAKRTKHQQKSTASLVVLALSRDSTTIVDEKPTENNAQNDLKTHALDSDLLLEVPEYESLDNQAVSELEDGAAVERSLKRIKLDIDFNAETAQKNDPDPTSLASSILPSSVRIENLPENLKSIDPNNQPHLNLLDAAQLLLRLVSFRQFSPSGSSLVEEQLMAVASRVVANNSELLKEKYGPTNWLIFSKALYERSIIEASNSKTVERGIFQMQALVEELNLEIRSKYFSAGQEVAAASSRLRFIHILPLAPRWALDAALAERFMSIGVTKSALEIYERLHMASDMAVCYVSIGDEKEAQNVIRKRLESHPEDARAMSILGDLTQDPQLWEKAWTTKRYANAKVSLVRYYYSKKVQDKANIDIAIKHMNEALRFSPISFDNWYFYGCMGLETEQYELAAEAFTRCVLMDPLHNHSWSNLGSALLSLGKAKEAVSAYQNAIKTSEAANWHIWDNYLIAASKIGDWNQVVRAARELLTIKGDASVIKPELVDVLVGHLVQDKLQEPPSFFQKQCMEYVCVQIPKFNSGSSRLWKSQAKVELWAKRPWEALACYERAYRVDVGHPDLTTSEDAWAKAVESCEDLVASYESLGDMEGRMGGVVCKSWRFKAKSSVKLLMNKGRDRWEHTEGWQKLETILENGFA